MSTVVLGLVIVALLAERFLSNRTHAAEIARLNNAVIAKTPAELRMLNEVAPDAPVRKMPEPSKIDGFVGQVGLS